MYLKADKTHQSCHIWILATFLQFFKASVKFVKGIVTVISKVTLIFSSLTFIGYSRCRSLFLSSIFFNLLKSPSFLSSLSSPLLKTLSKGEYSNLAYSTTLGLYPKSSSVMYSYFLNSPENNADILAANLSKSY